ncbi:hypothetical protein O3P69_014607 [Scylla paramamosain]|uniref:Ig-like domain-containing protein n=1 Tax=Scylla paramamosain TaxID=85552 RepID=A0AAW0TY35_SCYPA
MEEQEETRVPWVLWYRDGRLVDDTTSEDADGVFNAYEVSVTAEEGGAVYECSVTNDLLETPYTANVTLTVYYAPRTVTVLGPSQVEDGVTINLTCFTSVSNPPASLAWSVAGEMREASKAVVAPQEDGGWVSTSHLTHYKVDGANLSAVQVECRAVNPAIDHVVKKLKSITITQPPGPPRFLGDLRREVIAGTTLEVTCSSEGGRPPPSLRIYKAGEALLTDLQRSGNTTMGQAQVQVTPGDNGAEVTCEATNSPDSAPPSASFTLSVLFSPKPRAVFPEPLHYLASAVTAAQVFLLRLELN